MGSFTNKTIQIVMAMAEGVFSNGANQITVPEFVVSSDSGDTVIVAPKEDQTLTVPRGKIVST